MQSSDPYIKKREEKTKELKMCQQKRNLKSCFECKELIGCTIRKAYVQAVYESMSKGQSGGFEF